MGRRFVTTLLILSFGAVSLYVGLRGFTVALLGALLVLTAMGTAYIWNRFVFSKLTLERTLNRRHADFGVPVTMQLGVTNRKIFPLFGLKVRFTISSGLDCVPSSATAVKEADHDVFQEVFHLNWYEKRNRTFELRPRRRGRFSFGVGDLEYSDPFGFFTNSKQDVFRETQLIVFPKIVPIQGLASLNTYLFGSRPRDGWIFVDPLNRIGTRPYASTDSARLINWKATARHIQTQVNIEKPSFDQQVYLVLDQPPDLAWWTSRVSNTLEVAIMVLASLIQRYSEAGFDIRLATNVVSRTHGTGQLPSGATRGRAQRNQHLTNLALLQLFSLEPISKVLARRKNQIKPGSTVVIVTTAQGKLEPSFVKMARSLGLKSKVAVVRVVEDKKDVAKEESLKEWWIEGSVAWHEADQLELY